MFDKVTPEPGLVAGEHETLKFWETAEVFEKLRAQNAGKAKWSFLDGPITANNPMGVHHAWGRTYKDAFQRYFAMNGYDQRWQNGFDCQGLWVEVQTERDLGFKSKRDIEEYGLENFINKCKERVLKFVDMITQQSIRLGMWMDWPNSYLTMSEENNYSIWGFLKKCHERGFIYKGLDSMPWCPRCGTGISEQERKDGYRQVEDEAVYVRFPLRGREREYLLVWTTTPWTLAANVAAAVNPDLRYSKVLQGGDTYYLARGRLDVLNSERKARGEPEVTGEVSGAEMIGWTYDGPFDELEAVAPAVSVHQTIEWDEVSETSGTGIVHIAPGCGKEDFALGKEHDFPVIAPIDESGIYCAGFGPLSGKSALDVAPDVYDSLKAKGLFYKSEKYLHDYPHCWRCDTPLLFRAVDEWYINMSWRDEIKDIVGKIRWIPGHGEAQEIDWLRNMGDWMISKKRYWGLALPIWECSDCGHFEVVGSREELQAQATQGWDEFEGHTPHRPWVDAVKIACAKCGGVAERIADVGNPWLDAGIIPYSTVKYRQDREFWSNWIPADLVVENFPGQFRNWFYSLLTMSTMLEQMAPFKTLLGHADVRDEHGEEFHKSTNNIEFNEAADKMSADVMRWMYCRHPATNNLTFSYHAGEQLQRKVFGTLWNSYLFFCNYALLDEFDPASTAPAVSDRPEIDRWILSDLQLLVRSARDRFEDYWLSPFVRNAEEFIDQLSNWYIRRNRQRFWNPRGSDEQDKMAAYHTLHEVLLTLVKLLAPVIPFLTERMYQNLTGGGFGGVANHPKSSGAPISVHLDEYPRADEALLDEELSFQMGVVRQVAGTARALREEAETRVRQPLAQMRVAAGRAHAEALTRLSGLLVDELNIKDLVVVSTLGDLTSVSATPNFASLGPKFGKHAQKAGDAVRAFTELEIHQLQSGEPVQAGEFAIILENVTVHVTTKEGWAIGEAGEVQIALDVRLTPELEREGLARDVVRHIQQLRRETGLNIEDHIEVAFDTSSAELSDAIVEWADYIRAESQSVSLVSGTLGLEPQQIEIGSSTLTLELRRA